MQVLFRALVGLLVGLIIIADPSFAQSPPTPKIDFRAPIGECQEAVLSDEGLMAAAVRGSQNAFDLQQNMLRLCGMYDPSDEAWWSLQDVVKYADTTGDRDNYLSLLGVSMQELEPNMVRMRVFNARQSYARFYQAMQRGLHQMQQVPNLAEDLGNLYTAYGGLLDPLPSPGYDRFSGAYDSARFNSKSWPFLRADSLLGFGADARIGEHLACVGREGFIGQSAYDLIEACRLDQWPKPVFELVMPKSK